MKWSYSCHSYNRNINLWKEVCPYLDVVGKLYWQNTKCQSVNQNVWVYVCAGGVSISCRHHCHIWQHDDRRQQTYILLINMQYKNVTETGIEYIDTVYRIAEFHVMVNVLCERFSKFFLGLFMLWVPTSSTRDRAIHSMYVFSDFIGAHLHCDYECMFGDTILFVLRGKNDMASSS